MGVFCHMKTIMKNYRVIMSHPMWSQTQFHLMVHIDTMAYTTVWEPTLTSCVAVLYLSLLNINTSFNLFR